MRSISVTAAAFAALAASFTLSACGDPQTSEDAAAEAEAPEAAATPDEGIGAGIAVNEKAPIGMELRNVAGDAASLADAMGEKGLVLLLVRSADWCPYCKAQLIQSGEIAGALSDRGYGLASLSYDAPEKLAEFAANEGIGYTLFSDQDSAMIDALGLRDPDYDEGSKAYGVPRASVLVLAPDGTVQAKHVTGDYKVRPENEYVLQMVDRVAG